MIKRRSQIKGKSAQEIDDNDGEGETKNSTPLVLITRKRGVEAIEFDIARIYVTWHRITLAPELFLFESSASLEGKETASGGDAH